MKQSWRVVVVAGLLVIALLAAFTMNGVSHAQIPVQTPAPAMGYRTIIVSGSGEASAAPDQALVTLGVQTDAESASQALTQNSQQVQGLMTALQQAGVAPADIQTQTVQVQPRQRSDVQPTPPPGQTSPQFGIIGYTATNTVQVRVRTLSQLGQLLDSAVKAGANQVQGIGFVISDPSVLTSQAQQAAWQDAQARAARLAALAGAQLGDVLQVTELSGAPIPYSGVAAAASSAAVPIAPGTQTVQSNIQVTWALTSAPASSQGAGGLQGSPTVTTTVGVSPVPTNAPATVFPAATATPAATETSAVSVTPSITTTVQAQSLSGGAAGTPGPTATAEVTLTATSPMTTSSASSSSVITATPPLLPVTGWERTSIPDLGISIEIPEGWTKQGSEWTWSAPGPGAPRLGIEWQDLTQGWQPEDLLPPGATILSRTPELLGGVSITRYTVQAPVNDSQPYSLPFQTHLVLQIDGRRAYDAFALARSREELAQMDDMLAHVLNSVEFTSGSIGPASWSLLWTR